MTDHTPLTDEELAAIKYWFRVGRDIPLVALRKPLWRLIDDLSAARERITELEEKVERLSERLQGFR